LVSAGIVQHYGTRTETLEVTNPISVTGKGDYTISGAVANTVVLSETPIRITNDADVDIEVQIVSDNIETEIEVNYMGKVELTSKDISDWGIALDKKATVVYTLVGDIFEADVEVEEGYKLVYAMDKENRFSEYATVKTVDEINDAEEDLPMDGDWNNNAEPPYCDGLNEFEETYNHCNGAKLWIVKSDDIEPNGILSWANMANYLYETDLIRYFKDSEGKITVPANSYIEFYPEYTINNLETGSYVVTTEVNPIEV